MARLTDEQTKEILDTLKEYLSHPSVDGSIKRNQLRKKLEKLSKAMGNG